MVETLLSQQFCYTFFEDRKMVGPMERIELSAKTSMTEDGITTVSDMIAAAVAMQHKAIAICDRDNIQAYPKIFETLTVLKEKMAAKGKALDFKVIFGVEVNVLDDELKNRQNPICSGYFDYSVVLLLKSWQRGNVIRELLSEAIVDDDHGYPVILKSNIERNRENLLVGAAGDMGELWLELVLGGDDATVAREMAFYDYVELIPSQYLKHWVVSEEPRLAHSIEEIQIRQKRLLAIAKQQGKPVVATNHPSLLTDEELVDRANLIYRTHKGFGDAEYPLFLLTTQDMQEQLGYLEAEDVRKMVIDNPHKLADMCVDFIRR